MNKPKAAVWIMLGQSNAVGHATPMSEEDRIKTPLKNVFGLSRKDNQSFTNTRLVWSGYDGCMNLAEEQDHTYSVPNCLAKAWQQHIDAGNAYHLPDLYIVQIAIGSQGVTEDFMWYPEREKKLVPGKLRTADISLFPFTEHIFSLLEDSFRQMGTEYEIIGLHWRGGESDCVKPTPYLEQHLKATYLRIFDRFNQLLRCPPLILHKMAFFDYMRAGDPEGKMLRNMNYINDLFDALQQHYPNASVFDPQTLPQYDPSLPGGGLVIADLIHYSPSVNRAVAEQILAQQSPREPLKK